MFSLVSVLPYRLVFFLFRWRRFHFLLLHAYLSFSSSYAFTMMKSAFVLALSAVVPAAMATYGGQTHTVEVGPNGMLAYYPEYVYADVGDTVMFNL